MLSKFFKNNIQGRFSFSQEGEDLILDELFHKKKNGFYVDVGAFDPWRFSNTALFYKKGWYGINIDPRPGFKIYFDQERPKDINIELAIAEQRTRTNLFIFDEEALNTICKKRADYLIKNTSYKLRQVIKIKTCTLTSILNKYQVEQIDFLSIDAEGSELGVLKATDWRKIRPTYLVLEVLNTKIEKMYKHPAIRFVLKRRYEPIAKTLRSVILKRI